MNHFWGKSDYVVIWALKRQKNGLHPTPQSQPDGMAWGTDHPVLLANHLIAFQMVVVWVVNGGGPNYLQVLG